MELNNLPSVKTVYKNDRLHLCFLFSASFPFKMQNNERAALQVPVGKSTQITSEQGSQEKKAIPSRQNIENRTRLFLHTICISFPLDAETTPWNRRTFLLWLTICVSPHLLQMASCFSQLCAQYFYAKAATEISGYGEREPRSAIESNRLLIKISWSLREKIPLFFLQSIDRTHLFFKGTR